MRFSIAAASISLFISLARGHGAITAVKGANGVTGAAFGIDDSTPRDGSRARPFQVSPSTTITRQVSLFAGLTISYSLQQDTSIIRDFEVARGSASACGRTKLGGVNDIAKSLEGMITRPIS